MVARRCLVKGARSGVVCNDRATFGLTGGLASCDRHLARAVRQKEAQQFEGVADRGRRVSVWVLPLDGRQ